LAVLEQQKTLFTAENPRDDKLPAHRELADVFARSHLFDPSHKTWDVAFREADSAIKAEQAEAEKAWRQAAEARLEVEVRRTRVEAHLGCGIDETPPLWPVGWSGTRLWLYTLVAFTSGLALALYEERHRVRQRARAVSWSERLLVWVVLLPLLALSGWWCYRQASDLWQAGQLSPWSDAGRAEADALVPVAKAKTKSEQDGAETEARVKELEKIVEAQRAAVASAWASRLRFGNDVAGQKAF